MEEFLKSNIGNQGATNPFNGDAFADFIAEQIRNALPQSPNWAGSQVNNSGQNQQGGGPAFNAANQTNKMNIKYNVFEMHDYLIARIDFSNTDPSKKKKILLNSYELLLTEEERVSPLLKIPLPKPVSSKKVRFSMQNDILEIQMLKKGPEDYSEYEVYETVNTNDPEKNF
ncbi:hypothetical protein V7147_10620 [Bacillus sp. JJ1521]|uniref:hypothetical protein n=1 Tax=Bacillus sp. JJ1521 TaxID=3122957 RepID=UPI002FFDB730